MEYGKQYTFNEALVVINDKVNEHEEQINKLQEYVNDFKDFKQNLLSGGDPLKQDGILLRSGNKITFQVIDDRLSFMEPIVTKMNAIIKTTKLGVIRDDVNLLLHLSLERKKEYEELKMDIEKLTNSVGGGTKIKGKKKKGKKQKNLTNKK